MPPFQEKKLFSAGKNVNQHAKISDELLFFKVIYPKLKILRLTNNCHHLCRPLLTVFNVNLTIFHVNLYIFSEVPPLRKCRPG